MIQDILKEIEECDLLVSSNVFFDGEDVNIFDCSMELVYHDPKTGDLHSYFALPLDTCILQYEKWKMYDAEKDEDLCSEVEFTDDKIVGFTQFRRATHAERMVFIRSYIECKGYFRSMNKLHDIPDSLFPCQYLWDALYKNPMTIHYPDYGITDKNPCNS